MVCITFVGFDYIVTVNFSTDRFGELSVTKDEVRIRSSIEWNYNFLEFF